MDENSFQPPFTSRGVANTSQEVENGLTEPLNGGFVSEECMLDSDIVCDWFECTFKHKRILGILEDFGLIVDQDVELYPRGMFGYTHMYVLGEKIKFLFSMRDNYTEEQDRMGVHLYLSGYACREFEKIYNWYWLFDYVTASEANVTRIDIAFDSFSDKYFTVSRVRKSLKNRDTSSKGKVALNIQEYNIDKGNLIGESVTFGSKASEVSGIFYNKLQERKSANYIVDSNIKHWYRFEIRIRRDSADALIRLLLDNRKEAGKIFLQVVNNYIDFKDPNDKDENKSRRETVYWWKSFLKQYGKLQLSNKAIQSSIQKKKEWIDNSVVKSLAMVFLADFRYDLNEYNGIELEQELSYFEKQGIEKLEKMDLAAINTYRLERGGSVLTEDDLVKLKKMIKNEYWGKI